MKSRRRKRRLPKTVFIVCLLLLIALILLILVPEIVDRGEKMYYPLSYEEEILTYSEINNLDPYFVMGLIRAESNFDDEAVSPVGAVGLMQIMPETGEWLAGKMELVDFSEDMLHEGAFNIRMGCFYLRLLLDYYGEPDTAVAAYNAGMGTVSGWLADGAYSEDGVTLYYIPYEETREYVERVNNYTEKYVELYGDAA